MIEQTLIDICEAHLEIGELPNKLATELLANHKNLIEQNAELKKRLAKLDGERIFVTNEYFDGTETRR